MIDDRDWDEASHDGKLDLLREEIDTICATLATAERNAGLRQVELMRGVRGLMEMIGSLARLPARTGEAS